MEMMTEKTREERIAGSPFKDGESYVFEIVKYYANIYKDKVSGGKMDVQTVEYVEAPDGSKKQQAINYVKIPNTIPKPGKEQASWQQSPLRKLAFATESLVELQKLPKWGLKDVSAKITTDEDFANVSKLFVGKFITGKVGFDKKGWAILEDIGPVEHDSNGRPIPF